MSGTTKWDDAANKDLIMAVLMSANNGSLNVATNWDNVTETMDKWGYSFSKSAMTQQWSKKIVKQLKERHGDIKATDNGVDSPKTPKKPAGPGKRATPKTPGTGRGKKRVAADDDDDNDDDEASPETESLAGPIAKNKTPRSAAKKAKYEEEEEEEEEGTAAKVKVEAMEMDIDEDMV